MQDLDKIPWHNLTHAYGSAEDVPALLQALRFSPPNDDREHGPLPQLYGNIWHQNSVYEATAFAVPFLIELAADPNVLDRCGVLNLLSVIAGGTSDLQVHESFLEMYVDPKEPVALSSADRKQWRQKNRAMIPGTAEFEEKKAQEMGYAQAARQAVAAGLPIYLKISCESTAVRYSAAIVLSRLRFQTEAAGKRLFEMIQEEESVANRACLILLLSRLKGQSTEVRELYEVSLDSNEIIERRAATLALANATETAASAKLKKAMVEAIFDSQSFEYLSSIDWFDYEIVYRAREKMLTIVGQDQDELVKLYLGLLNQPSQSQPSPIDQAVDDLLELVFRDAAADSEEGRYQAINHLTIKPVQQRVLKAIIEAMDRQGWLTISWMTYDLPDSRRSLRELAQGRPAFKPDRTWPRLSLAESPGLPAEDDALRIGIRVHSRFWGYGTIQSREYNSSLVLTVDYDEEGIHRHYVQPESALVQLWWRALNLLRPWLGKHWTQPKTAGRYGTDCQRG